MPTERDYAVAEAISNLPDDGDKLLTEHGMELVAELIAAHVSREVALLMEADRKQIRELKDLVREMISVLDMYANEDHWFEDTFRPLRLEKGCRCFSCVESFSDRGKAALDMSEQAEQALRGE